MSLNSNENVVVDKDKFAVSLGVPESQLDAIIDASKFCTITGLIGAIIAWLLYTPLVIKIFGLTIVIGSGLVGTLAGGVLVGLTVGVIVYWMVKKCREKLGTTQTIPIEFPAPLSKIGIIVAEVVFVPAVCLALMDWSDEKREFILSRLKDWGYDGEWSKRFLKELCDDGGDILNRTIQIISKKNLGGIKDKTVTRSYLVKKTEELLNDAKQEFAWDQVAVEERKAAIVKRMKEVTSNRFTWRVLLCPWRRAEKGSPH